MKTEVVLKRPFLTGEVSQKSKSGLFNVNDLVNIANQKRRELGKRDFNLSQYLKTKSFLEFINELQNEIPTDVLISKNGKGRNSTTWVHPLIFIDIALAVDPKFKISVYQWLYDELLKYRNSSGDSYKKMVGALYERSNDKARFNQLVKEIAVHIKQKLKVDDWNTATEEQLKKRDKIHENIILLSDVLKDVNQVVRIAVDNVLKD